MTPEEKNRIAKLRKKALLCADYGIQRGELSAIIEEYWSIQAHLNEKDTTPTFLEALAWADTEKGEAIEAYFSMDQRWVRHNPDDHPRVFASSVVEELGDMIMMIFRAADRMGDYDPITMLLEKIADKCGELSSQERP